VDLAITDIV